MRKGTADPISLTLPLDRMFSSFTLFIIYRMPKTLARKNTAKAKTRFHGSSSASSPWLAFAHLLMTGCTPSVIFILSMMKLEPSKNVATAPPRSNGPRMPLSTRKHWNVRAPKKLPSLFWLPVRTSGKRGVLPAKRPGTTNIAA